MLVTLYHPKDLVHLSALLKNLLFTSLLVCEHRKKIQLYLISARSCSVTEGLKSSGYEHGKIYPKQKEDTASNSCMTRICCFWSVCVRGGKATVTLSVKKLSANIIIMIKLRREAKLFHLFLTFSRYLMLFRTSALIPSRAEESEPGKRFLIHIKKI